MLVNILQNTEDLLTRDSYLASMTAVARLTPPPPPPLEINIMEKEKEGEGQRSENELTPLILTTAPEKTTIKSGLQGATQLSHTVSK